jgi:hypothetical protein
MISSTDFRRSAFWVDIFVSLADQMDTKRRNNEKNWEQSWTVRYIYKWLLKVEIGKAFAR